MTAISDKHAAAAKGIRDESSRNFTLIELLVVVAVVALVAALLLPALVQAKAKAKSVACKGNLRQQGVALVMYFDDYGRYPGSALVYRGDGSQTMGSNENPFLGSIQRYCYRPDIHRSEPGLNLDSLFTCPGKPWVNDEFGGGPRLYRGIGYLHNSGGTARRKLIGKSLGLSPVRFSPRDDTGAFGHAGNGANTERNDRNW